MLEWVTSYVYQLVIFSVLVGLLLRRNALKTVQERFFAYVFATHVTPDLNKLLHAYREKLFKVLHESENQSKNGEHLRILEVGAGSGCNFQYYPAGSRVILVEPNPYFNSYLLQNCARASHLVIEKFHQTTGEDMRDVPDNSVDVVAVTNVLCSVTNIEQVLREIRRVLVPGGKYLFLEHSHDLPGTWRHTLQNWVEMSGMWTLASAGCHVNRNMTIALEKAGFSKCEYERFSVNVDLVPWKYKWLIYFAASHFMGSATK